MLGREMTFWIIAGLLTAILLALVFIAAELVVIRSNVVGLLRLGATRGQFVDEAAEQHLGPIQTSINQLARAIAGDSRGS